MLTPRKNSTKDTNSKPPAAPAKVQPTTKDKTAPLQPKSKTNAPASKPAQSATKNPSALDAATKVLAEANSALTTGEMVEQMSAKGYWTSPGGKTPAATLYSAILRELKIKGEAARFAKTERGRFMLKK